MGLKLGGNQINKAYLGTTEIQKMYLGSDMVFDNTLQIPTGITLREVGVFSIISYNISEETNTTAKVDVFMTEQCSINYYVNGVKNAASSDDFNAGEIGTDEFRHTRTLTNLPYGQTSNLIIELTAESNLQVIESDVIPLTTTGGATGLIPILTNFRDDNTNPDRIYFSTPLGYPDGMTIIGFEVSGRSITEVNKVSDTEGYFTLDTPLTYWDNNTIRLESSNIIYPFTLTYIDKNIAEPDATNNKYVSADGNGDGSEGNPWGITQIDGNAEAGMTLWMKAGSYPQGVELFLGKSGTPTNPIKLIGYTSVIGDINESMATDFTYVDDAQARAYVDPTKYPVLTGGGSDVNEVGLGLRYAENVIVRNLQIQDSSYNIWVEEPCKNIVLDNVLGGWGQVDGTAYGRGLLMNHNANGPSIVESSRCVNSLFINNQLQHVQMDGTRNMLKDCQLVSGDWEPQGDGTDYWCSATVGEDIIYKDNQAISVSTASHGGHGIGVKADGNEIVLRCLIEGNNIDRIGEAIMLAHENVQFCVVKNNTTDNYGDGGSAALVNRDGAHDNVFENNYVKDVAYAILQWRQGAENPDHESDTLSLNNTWRNNIFNGYLYATVWVIANQQYGEKVTNCNIVNNTFYNGGGFMDYTIGPSPAYAQIDFVSLNFTNNIFDDISGQWYDSTTPSGNINYLNNNFHNITANNYPGLPANNINVDPNWEDTTSFVPQTEMQVAKVSGANYDYNGDERTDPTTIGAQEILTS